MNGRITLLTMVLPIKVENRGPVSELVSQQGEREARRYGGLERVYSQG